MCNNNRSTVCLFNFSACFSNEIQTDDAQKPVFIGTILHCTYSFRGLRPQTPTGTLALDSAGGLLSLIPPALPLPSPCHYILDKGLSSAVFEQSKLTAVILFAIRSRVAIKCWATPCIRTCYRTLDMSTGKYNKRLKRRT